MQGHISPVGYRLVREPQAQVLPCRSMADILAQGPPLLSGQERAERCHGVHVDGRSRPV